VLQRPLQIRKKPIFRIFKDRFCPIEIIFMVSSKIYLRFLARMALKKFKERMLYQSFLVMSVFGPRVRKENKYFGEFNVRRLEVDEFISVGFEKE
jgi:hypothetical protein